LQRPGTQLKSAGVAAPDALVEGSMRVSVLGVLVVSLAAGGCARGDTAAAAAASPVGTGGRADAVPAAASKTSAVREVTIPAGATLSIVLDTPVGSDTSRVEEHVTAHLARPIVVGGAPVVPAGSRVGGVVTDATRSGKVKGRAHVAVKFESLSPAGEDERYTIQTTAVGRTAAATKKKDALEIGAPAAGGALIGALVGGKKGALVGGAVGGGAGTAVVMSTRGKEVHMPKGTALTLKLAAPVTVRVRG
jgi:hypothetical protein